MRALLLSYAQYQCTLNTDYAVDMQHRLLFCDSNCITEHLYTLSESSWQRPPTAIEQTLGLGQPPPAPLHGDSRLPVESALVSLEKSIHGPDGLSSRSKG